MSIKFSAGKYYVGDLGYAIKDYSDWEKLILDTNCFQDESSMYKGHQIFCASIEYGDGTFYDQNDMDYKVCAGMIGVMPFEVVEDSEGADKGQVIEFENDFEAYEEDGIFYIGGLEINTRNEEDNDDEDWEDEEDAPSSWK